MSHPKSLSKATLTPDNIYSYTSKLNHTPAIDLAEVVEHKPENERLLIFNHLTQESAVKVFEYLPVWLQQELLHALPSELAIYLLNMMAPDDRTATLESLPPEQMSQLIKYLSPEEKAVTLKLLGYPENSVGRLMTPDYIAINLNWTVRDVLNYIRENGRDSETINVIYAVDHKGVLIDDFRIREFLIAPLDTKVRHFSDNYFVALQVEDSEQDAINIFRKYDRVALPVVDSKGVLLGIVTFDDIMDAAVKEDTQDIQNIGGVEALTEPYMATPFFSLMHKRMSWLIILFVGEMFTATAMGYFEHEIAKAVVLALFIPLIISSGGNAGSQASSLIIRALALGEISLSDWWKVMRREILSGVFLGCVLGLIGFVRVFLWSMFTDIYGSHTILLGLTIFASLIGVVLWGTIVGSMLPIMLQRLGFDPAVSSAPFVATLVDVTGIVIYFSIAMLFLQGTLL